MSMFPSPLGVIFSRMRAFLSIYLFYFFVSVSSRSYLFSYFIYKDRTLGKDYSHVSVSSRSYLFSYKKNIYNFKLVNMEGFRLLSELSFLVYDVKEI